MSLSSRRRGDMNPKLHMDRQPMVTRITDPSLPAGKRREIDNVMKKARANTNDYWDKKLLEVEEKDPNRWRHTGYKKMYIQGESSSGESDREGTYRYNSQQVGGGTNNNNGGPPSSARYGRSRTRSPHSRSRSRIRKSPPRSPIMRRRTPPSSSQMHAMDDDGGCRNRRMSPPSSIDGGHTRGRPRSPPPQRMMPRSPSDMGGRRSRPRSPINRRRSPTNSVGMPANHRRRSPGNQMPPLNKRGESHILPRSKRPPSPPPKRHGHSRSNSSVSSFTDDSCSSCSQHASKNRSRSNSFNRNRRITSRPRSPPPKQRKHYVAKTGMHHNATQSHLRGRPVSPPPPPIIDKYRNEKVRRGTRERSMDVVSSDGHGKLMRSGRHSPPPEDPRLKNRPPEPPEPAASSSSSNMLAKKNKKKSKLQLRPRIKIEGEKHKKHKSSSESDDSAESDSESSLKAFTAATRLSLSERFGRIAQWSADKLQMDNMNMRITKDSGGAFKVMIQEGVRVETTPPPPQRRLYSPAPPGHFPDELATTAPSDIENREWGDVRFRYSYYKDLGYLRGLTLQEYMKWEEWWYKYQDWVSIDKRRYEYWRAQEMRRRRRKLPITQRLN